MLANSNDLYRPQIEQQLLDKNVKVDEETERYILNMLSEGDVQNKQANPKDFVVLDDTTVHATKLSRVCFHASTRTRTRTHTHTHTHTRTHTRTERG